MGKVTRALKKSPPLEDPSPENLRPIQPGTKCTKLRLAWKLNLTAVRFNSIRLKSSNPNPTKFPSNPLHSGNGRPQPHRLKKTWGIKPQMSSHKSKPRRFPVEMGKIPEPNLVTQSGPFVWLGNGPKPPLKGPLSNKVQWKTPPSPLNPVNFSSKLAKFLGKFSVNSPKLLVKNHLELEILLCPLDPGSQWSDWNKLS